MQSNDAQHSTGPVHGAAAADDAALRDYLASRHEACPGCGYDLHALVGTRCPECNQELRLRVGLAEPRLRLFLAAVIGNALGLGFSGLLCGFVVIATLVGQRGSAPPRFWLVCGVPLVVQGVVMLVLLRKGRALRRASVAVRAGVVLACVLLTLGNLTLFSALVR